jgi:hypothetical protein
LFGGRQLPQPFSDGAEPFGQLAMSRSQFSMPFRKFLTARGSGVVRQRGHEK